MLAAAVVQPLVGLALDRFGGRPVLAIGLGFAGAALCGTALADQFWQVVVLMGFATSIGYAALSPISATTIVSTWFDKNRGTAIGVATSGTKVAMIALPPTIAALILQHDWRLAMLAVGCAILVMMPAVILFMRPAPGFSEGRSGASAGGTSAVPPEVSTTVRQALLLPAFWTIALSLFANGLVMNLVFVHLPFYVMSRGFDTAMAATGLALLGGIGIFGTIVTGWMSDWLGRKEVLLIMFGARAVATLLVVMSPNILTFAAFVLVFGLLGYGAIGVIGSFAAGVFGRRSIGTILGLAYVFNQVGGAVGIFAGGASLEWTGDLDASLWLAVGTTVVALPCIMLVTSDRSSSTAPKLS